MRRLLIALLIFSCSTFSWGQAQNLHATSVTIHDPVTPFTDEVVIDLALATTLDFFDSSTVGDILLGVAAPADWSKLNVSSTVGQILRVVAGPTLAYGALDLANANATTGGLVATSGGTGQTVYVVGDILYANTTTTLSKLAIGANKRALTLTGGLPTWSPIDVSDGTDGVTGALGKANGGTGLATMTAGDMLYEGGTSAISKLAIPADINYILGVAESVGVRRPSWTNAPVLEDITINNALVVKSDDTDFLLTTDPAANDGEGIVGMGTLAPTEGTLHVSEGTAGTVAAHVRGSIAVFESDGVVGTSNGGISILVPDSDNANIYFGTPTATNDAGLIQVFGATASDVDFNFFVEGQHWLRFRGDHNAIVLNEGSNDYDLRVESDNNQGILFTDGANDLVGINTTSPAAKLDIFNDDEAQPTLALGAESGGVYDPAFEITQSHVQTTLDTPVTLWSFVTASDTNYLLDAKIMSWEPTQAISTVFEGTLVVENDGGVMTIHSNPTWNQIYTESTDPADPVFSAPSATIQIVIDPNHATTAQWHATVEVMILGTN